MDESGKYGPDQTIITDIQTYSKKGVTDNIENIFSKYQIFYLIAQ